MAETKFTDGPWQAEQAMRGDGMPINEWDIIGNAEHPTGEPVVVATVHTSAADANLGASAPDLYAALEALLPVAQAFEKQASRGAGGRRGGVVFAQARAALSKARGE